MGDRAIYITKTDMQRLRPLLRASTVPFRKQQPYLLELQTQLNRATVLADQDVAPDAVRMNSDVRLSDSRTGAVVTCRIVFPECADAAEGRISVLAPLGAALLGHRVGDQVSFEAPAGLRTCAILELVHQHEEAGGLQL